MTSAKGWELVKKAEREFRKAKYLTYEKRLKINDDLYMLALKVAPEKVQPPWPGDDNWHKIPHLRNLIETRMLYLNIFKKKGNDSG